MHSINLDELRNAFEFVSSGPSSQNFAYMCMDTGIIYWKSNVMDLEEEIPADLDTSDRYIAVPHKNDLQLGQSLALSFIDQEIPHEYNFVASLFRKRGAYRRFKELLQSVGLLEKWFAFEANASDIALQNWCKENNIELV
jgi:hypothetical protein